MVKRLNIQRGIIWGLSGVALMAGAFYYLNAPSRRDLVPAEQPSSSPTQVITTSTTASEDEDRQILAHCGAIIDKQCAKKAVNPTLQKAEDYILAYILDKRGLPPLINVSPLFVAKGINKHSAQDRQTCLLKQALSIFDAAEDLGNARYPGQFTYLFALYCRQQLAQPLEKEIDNLSDPWSYAFIFARGDLPIVRCLYYIRCSDGNSVWAKTLGGNFAPFRDAGLRKMLHLMGVKRGSIIADVGGGTGRLAWLEQEVVGPQGRVYLSDIDATCQEFLKFLPQRFPQFASIKRVKFINGTLKNPKLPEPLDFITMSDVHMIRDQEWQNGGKEFLQTLRQSLKAKGRLGIYEGRFNSDAVIKAKNLAERQAIVDQRLAQSGFRLVNLCAIDGSKGGYFVIAECQEKN